jgi:hypothetical protein
VLKEGKEERGEKWRDEGNKYKRNEEKKREILITNRINKCTA